MDFIVFPSFLFWTEIVIKLIVIFNLSKLIGFCWERLLPFQSNFPKGNDTNYTENLNQFNEKTANYLKLIELGSHEKSPSFIACQ